MYWPVEKDYLKAETKTAIQGVNTAITVFKNESIGQKGPFLVRKSMSKRQFSLNTAFSGLI